MTRTCFYLGLCMLVVLLHNACFEEEFTTAGDVRLDFSTDTLRFDTVFTEVGSATRALRVYNPHDLAVRISKVYLENVTSFFRINVDGQAGPAVENVEIRANDSIWIFAEVTVDPDQPLSKSPFVIEEQLYLEINGNVQKVLLEAWGQNANYFPNRFHQNRVSVLSCNLGEEVWNDPRPYVIYGTLLIDSCTLVWPAGTRIYVHGGIADNQLGTYNDGILYTLPRGRIHSAGTVEDPVIVQDDRIEEDYTGLWGGIHLGPQSGTHRFFNTIVRNAVTAIAVDSLGSVELENVQLHGTAGSGLFARHAEVTARNSLFYDNGAAGVALTFGGDYQLDYCTIASYRNDGAGLILNNWYCTDPLCQEAIFVNTLDARIRNCIIAGSAPDELLLSDATRDDPDGRFNVSLQNCIVKIDDLLDPDGYPEFFESLCTDCLEFMFSDTLFVDAGEFDFHLDTLSIAEQQAIPLPGIPMDLEGNLRDEQSPDIGCFEYVMD